MISKELHQFERKPEHGEETCLCSANSLCQSTLDVVEPSILPTYFSQPLRHQATALRTEPWLNVAKTTSTFESDAIQSFCQQQSLSLDILAASAWSLVLREYTATDGATFAQVATPFSALAPKNGPQQDSPDERIWHCRADGASSIRDVLSGQCSEFLQLCSTRSSLKSLYNTAICLRPRAEWGDIGNSGHLDSKLVLVTGLDLTTKHVTTYITHDPLQLEPSYASDLSDAFAHALIEIIGGADRTLEEVDLTNGKLLDQIQSWTPECPKASRTYIPDAISDHAKRNGDASAICSWDAELSYHTLDDLSNRLAHHLQSLGVGPESRVLTCFEKSAWTIVTLLAILKAGAAFIPIDPKYPIARVTEILEQTQAELLLASAPCSQVQSLPTKSLIVDSAFLHSLQPQLAAPRRLVGPHNLAYILFTSGSTGQPKGVMIEHEAFSTSIEAHGRTLKLGQESRALQFTSYTFDPSLTEIFATLLYGGCVCVPEQNARVTDLGRCVNDFKVNWAFFTPSVIALIQPSEVPDLKTVAVGGEAVTQDCVDTWASKVELFNAYGPTECCIFCLVSPIQPCSNPANIGYGVGSRPWIVSPRNHHKISPPGSVGELVIEGKIQSRGYLNDAEKTNLTFVSQPKWARSLSASNRPQRLYKTGDLARYNADGSITCLGRKDRQVKIRGQRIEPGEIESRIKQHLGGVITQAIVDISRRGFQKSSQVLTAFLELDRAQMKMRGIVEPLSGLVPAITDTYRELVGTLEASLSNSLPGNMVPAVFVPLTALPKTTSGKIDRAQLQTISDHFAATSNTISRRGAAEEILAPRTKTELILRKEWSKLLAIPELSISPEDRFFALGGDSILAIKLVSATRRQDLYLTVADMFHNSTLSSMASVVRKAEDHANLAPEPFSMISRPDHQKLQDLIKIVARQCQVCSASVQDIYPCTPFQESIMAVSADQTGLYTGQFTFELPKNIDLHRFRAAWNEARRHIGMLRTRIVDLPGVGFVQVEIDEDIEWLYPGSLSDYCLLGSKYTPEYGARLSKYALIEQNGRTWFVWTIHHSLYDGWCLPKYLEVVSEIYAGDRRGLSSIVPFQSFVRHFQDSFVKEESSSFWGTVFDNVSSPQFPRLPSPMYEPQIDTSAAVTAVIPEKSLPHFTNAMLAQAAWALVVAQHTGSRDVIFGSAVSGRNRPLHGIESIAGPTLATIPIRVQIDYHDVIGSFLDALLDRATAVMPREQDGLHTIRQASDSARNACDFQNILVVQSDHGQDDVRDGQLLQIAKHQAESVNTQSLALECVIEKDVLKMEARFDGNLITHTLMQRILDQWRHVVQQLAVADSEQSVGNLSFISPEDIGNLESWNAVVPPPMPGFVHEQMSMWANLQPQATAICSWEGNMTYAQLEDYSSRLAGLLVACGVGAESVIPLHFDKGIPVVVSMMAVLKAGAAFVPLDCAAPDARIKEILAQVDASIVLTSKGNRGSWPSNVQPLPIDFDLLLTLPKRNMPLSIKSQPHDLAYVIMTSGSTGKPKGVMIEHSSLSTSVEYHGRYYGLGRQSRVLQFASLAFDAAVGDVVATIVYGGCLVVPHKDTRTDNLTEFINNAQVNWSFFTPSTLKTFSPSDVPTIETLVVGGEAITNECMETWAGEVHLINGYGPSETTIACAAASVSPDGANRGSIGRGLGCLTWVVTPDNHDRLSPLGCVGELVIQGPIVGRGYLDDREQTQAAFIEDPLWLNTGTQEHVRFYKTGDLVHYNDDGTLQYVGRKDSQVKVRGQRVELGEIESRIQSNNLVEHAAVTFPASGGCKGHIVACLTLNHQHPASSDPAVNNGIQPSNQNAVASAVNKVRNSISEQVPSYMVPDYWVVLDTMPITTSGKVDRKKLTHWIVRLNSIQCQIYRAGKSNSGTNSLQQPSSPNENLLQRIWADVLNVPLASIGVNRSFLTIGGDSLTAMQALRRCRTEGLKFHVADVLRGQTIAQLAGNLERVQVLPTLQEEKSDELFDLSPIQRVYAVAAPQSECHHFNQSRRLLTKYRLNHDAIYHALGAVARRHSMLRARFVTAKDGSVAQCISNDIESSYCVRVHSSINTLNIDETIARSQRALSVKEGPIITADVFNSDSSDKSTLFLVAHHLVVDNVSWGILLDDLEAFLSQSCISGPVPLSFQTWCSLQNDHVQQRVNPKDTIAEGTPPTDLAYWGVTRSQITYGAAAREIIALDDARSKTLAGNCHEALHTELMDVFVAAILISFQHTFEDRGAPNLFTEAHGRESFAQDIDPSNTVGWFTTLCSNAVQIEAGQSPIAALKQVKDMRRRIRSNGWESFSSRFLHPEGQGNFKDCDFPEIVLNYSGMSESQSSPDSFFGTDPNSNGDTDDMSPNMPRFALMDIAASYKEGRFEFEWLFSPTMRHAEKIIPWTRRCMHVLEQLALGLSIMSPEYTPSDFPLMSMSDRDLNAMMKKTLPEAELKVPEEIETIYPASPMQEAILAAQASSPRYFRARVAFEVVPRGTTVLDVDKLSRAWQIVVDQTPILRTVLLPHPNNKGCFVQVVLRSYSDSTRTGHGNARLAHRPLDLPPAALKLNKPHHKLTICKAKGERVFCCWDVSHALIDHSSMSILFEALSQAYDSEDMVVSSAPYADLISHICSTPNDLSLEYWSTYLLDSESCRLAVASSTDLGELQSTSIDLSPYMDLLNSVTQKAGVTMANVFRLAWGLLLCQHIGTNDVTFGHIVSGRDLQTPEVDRIVGPLLNIMACRFRDPSRSTAAMLSDLQNDFLRSLPHQHHLSTFLRTSQEYASSGIDGHFDTLVNFRRHADEVPSFTDRISFEPLQDEDPFNYAIVVEVDHKARGEVTAALTSWSGLVPKSMAQKISESFAGIIGTVLAELN